MLQKIPLLFFQDAWVKTESSGSNILLVIFNGMFLISLNFYTAKKFPCNFEQNVHNFVKGGGGGRGVKSYTSLYVLLKELRLGHTLKFSNSFIFSTGWCKRGLIFQS